MSRAGWASQLAVARPSGRSDTGTSGGAGVFWKKHLAVRGQGPAAAHAAAQRFTGHDWSAIVARIGRAPIAI
eukprot:10697877-Lingulodinium_polyedra.AAC.1